MARASLMIVLFYLMHYSGRDLLIHYGLVSPSWASFVVYCVLFVFAIIVYGRQLASEWGRLRKRRKKSWSFLPELLLWTLLGFAVTVGMYFTVKGIFNVSILPAGQGPVRDAGKVLASIAGTIFFVLITSLVHELTFRQSLIGVGERTHKFQLFLSSLISILAYVLIQIKQPVEFWYYLPMSVLLTIFYLRYDRNVWASTAYHALFNTISYLLIQFVPAISKL